MLKTAPILFSEQCSFSSLIKIPNHQFLSFISLFFHHYYLTQLFRHCKEAHPMKRIKKPHLIFQNPKTPTAILKAEKAKRLRETTQFDRRQAEENEKLAQIRALAQHLNLV